MKRTATVFMTICVVLSLLSACGGSTAGGADAQVQLKNLSATVQLSELPNAKSGHNTPASEGTVYYEEEIIRSSRVRRSSPVAEEVHILWVWVFWTPLRRRTPMCR